MRNLINQTNVPSDPDKNMKAAENFLLLLINTHVAADHIMLLYPTESLQQLADWSVVNLKPCQRLTNWKKENVIQDSEFICHKFFLWAYCGMDFMMQFVKMKKDPLDIGSFGLCC